MLHSPPSIKRFRAPLTLILVAACATLGFAGERPDTPSDDFWEINTRCAPRCRPADPASEAITFRRCENGTWQDSTRAALLDPTDARPLVIFVHGNLSQRGDALHAAGRLRSVLRCGAEGRAYRLALWSWPAGRVTRGIRRDALVKAGYSDTQALYLAALLQQLDPDVPVTLVGYSFGARAVCGALHLLDGGQAAGLRLDEPDASPPKQIRAVLVAAAMHAYWLGSGQRLGRALPMTTETTILVNSADPVLRRYAKLYGRRPRCGPAALGYVGPYGLASQARDRVRLVHVHCSVGRHHDWNDYLRSGQLRQAVVQSAFAERCEDPARGE